VNFVDPRPSIIDDRKFSLVNQNTFMVSSILDHRPLAIIDFPWKHETIFQFLLTLDHHPLKHEFRPSKSNFNSTTLHIYASYDLFNGSEAFKTRICSRIWGFLSNFLCFSPNSSQTEIYNSEFSQICVGSWPI
jgi:hypothetical protein